jgi:hypothetical protein
MISSSNFTIGVICNKCVIPNCSHLSRHRKVHFNILRGHLWMIIMNLVVPMRFRLRFGSYIDLPIMFFIIRGIVAPSGAMAILNALI